jgi:hypothetical protein
VDELIKAQLLRLIDAHGRVDDERAAPISAADLASRLGRPVGQGDGWLAACQLDGLLRRRMTPAGGDFVVEALTPPRPASRGGGAAPLMAQPSARRERGCLRRSPRAARRRPRGGAPGGTPPAIDAAVRRRRPGATASGLIRCSTR